MTAGGGQAHASAACDAVNAGAHNRSAAFSPTVYVLSAGPLSSFAVGENVTFTITADHPGGPGLGIFVTFTLQSGNATVLATAGPAFTPVTQVVNYTITGNNQDTTLEYGATFNSASSSITATCTPAAAKTTDSDKLRALQVGVSKLAADTSGAAITNAVDGAINGALNNGGNPVTVGPNGITFNFAAEPRSPIESRTDEACAALGYAQRTVKAPPYIPPERLWSAWAEVRGTGWERNDPTAGLRGDQLNVTAGIGRKLTPNFVVGVLAGYEHFKYDVASLTGTMKGDGGTIGGYAGWRIARHLRWDATLAWSGISYNAVAATAAGSFHGSRLLASTGLTGTYRWAAFLFEPSACIYGLWERENAYTDSLGTLQGARSFAVGRASAGGKAIYPWLWRGDINISPYLGLYADYRFSSDNAVPVGQPIVWVGDGLSGRVTGGVAVSRFRGGTVALGSEVGGLGADYKMWSVNGRVFWPF